MKLRSTFGAFLTLLAFVSVAGAQTQTVASAADGARVTDVFLGQNRQGPYTLAWNHLQRRDMAVMVDGSYLTPDAYTLDAEKGVISFRDTLKTQSIARVDYTYDAAAAQHNPNPASSPVTLSLFQARGLSGNAALQVTALPGDPSKPGTTPLVVWGLSGRTNLFGGGLSSQILLAPSGAAGGGLGDRSGLRLGYGIGTDRNRIDASFLRAGKSFAPAAGRSFDMASQAQQWTLGGRVTPQDWMLLEFRLANLHDLGGGGASGQNALSVRLGGVGKQPTLNVSRAEETRSAADGAAAAVTTEKATVTGKIGDNTAVNAQGQRVVTDASKPGGDQTKQDASVSVATATKDNKAQAAVAVTGGTTETATGTQARQGVTVTLKPAPMVTLTAEARAQTDTATGGKDEKRSTFEAARAVVTPTKTMKVTTSVQVTAAPDQKKTITDISAEAQPWRFASVSGGVTNRAATNTGLLDTTRVRVALQPRSNISLSGGFVLNPEENGAVLNASRQNFGLATRFGALDVGGGYTLTTWAVSAIPAGLGAQSGEVSLNLGFRFSRYTALTGGYKNGFYYGATNPQGTHTYSLGLSHNLGSAFNLSLNGVVTEDRAQTGRPAAAKAEGKVGLKF